MRDVDDGSSTLVIRKTLAATRERVFDAWSRPELMVQWFFPMPDWRAVVEADVRVGGRYAIEMIDPAGGVHAQSGEYREIRRPSRLVFTWTCVELEVEGSLVTVELEARGDATELVLTHQLRPDPRILREHEGGWNGCLGQLERFLGEA